MNTTKSLYSLNQGLLIILLCFTTNALWANKIVINNTNELYNIGEYTLILEDVENTLDPKQAWEDKNFKPSTAKVLNLGISNSTYWLKFKINNNTDEEKFIIQYNYPIVEIAELYLFKDNKLIAEEKLGEMVPITKRRIQHQDFLYQITLKKGETGHFLLKLESGQQIIAPMSVGSVNAIFKNVSQEDLYFGISFGILLVMFLYNFFVFLSIRDKSYLYYIVYLLFMMFIQSSNQGYSYRSIHPNMPHIAEILAAILPSLIGIVSVLFVREFLRTKHYTPKLDKGFSGLLVFYSLCVFVYFLGFSNLSYQLSQLSAIIASFYGLFVAYKIMRMGYRPAKFFLVAWSVFLIGIIIFVLKDVGVLPYNDFTSHMLEISAALEAILLSIALADRINILRKEKEGYQQKTVEALRENERIITQQNIILEEKVDERTKKLNNTLIDLKETQSQLVSAEKMASLGQLTAGIAHEINNPINYVKSNVSPLQKDFQDLLDILGKYEEVFGSNGDDEKFKEVDEFKKSLEFELVKEEVFELLNGIDEGANRTAEIVKSLRIFSRLDEDVLKVSSINDGLKSTVKIIGTNYSQDIIIKEKYGEIPSIICQPGKLNQVFMNVLNNAAQAVLDKTDDSEKIINVKTHQDSANLYISIKDNGVGIKTELLDKIFEPFFTTKDVGEGTGLGLSIAYTIIENHKGEIIVDTIVGEGTEIIIKLPK